MTSALNFRQAWKCFLILFKYFFNRGFSLAKFAISGFIATGATIGSALLYAGRNDKVRDDIESKIPLAKPVLSSIYGEKVKPEVFGSTNYPEYSLLNKETEKEEGDEIPKRLLPLVCFFTVMFPL